MIRSIIATELKNIGFEVFEEVLGISTDESTRRVDILALNRITKCGYILDPTICMEYYEIDQACKVNEEKQMIYQPCVTYFQRNYDFHHEIHVFGLLIGARGTIPLFVSSLFKKLKLPTSLLSDIALTAVKGSCSIFNHHLYKSTI